jgi:hypothetical protein
MKAAWYEKQGPPREVLVVGEMPAAHKQFSVRNGPTSVSW